MEVRNKQQQDLGMQLIIDRIGLLHENLGELREDTRESMKELAGTINKLVAIETNQSHMHESYSRILTLLEKSEEKHQNLDRRIDELEKEQPLTKQVIKWVMAAVWSVVAAAAMFAAKMLGIF